MTTPHSTTSFINAHSHATDAELASALVRHAGQLALTMRAAGVGTDFKTSISDVVTDADRAAEEFVAAALEALRPEDGVLGEEGAQRASQTGRTWVIDPVDGTYNFSQGSDYFCSAIALAQGDPADGNALIGAVHRPATDTTWVAAGGTATRDEVVLEALEDAPLSEKALVTYLHPTSMRQQELREAWLRAAQEAATIRMMGAGSVDLANIASGQMGGWLQHSVADWDWLPGKALVEAAGGRAVKVTAGGVQWCIAGNQQLVAEVEATLLAHD